MILRKAVELTQGAHNNGVGAVLAEKMSQYAGLLAAQGSLVAALSYLPTDANQVLTDAQYFVPTFCYIIPNCLVN